MARLAQWGLLRNPDGSYRVAEKLPGGGFGVGYVVSTHRSYAAAYGAFCKAVQAAAKAVRGEE